MQRRRMPRRMMWWILRKINRYSKMIDERTAVWVIIALIVARLMTTRVGYVEFEKPREYDTFPYTKGSAGAGLMFAN